MNAPTNTSVFVPVVEGCLRDGVPFNVERFSHVSLTEGFRTLLDDPKVRGKALRVSYGDGSESPALPLDEMCPAPEWQKAVTPIRLGFLSGRHPWLDLAVDVYVARDAELRNIRTGRDREAVFFERACAVLADPLLGDAPMVEVYHTGLQSLTLGFYRALLWVASRRGLRRAGCVRPMFKFRSPVVDLLRLSGVETGRLAQVWSAVTAAASDPTTTGFLRVTGKPGDAICEVLWDVPRPMFLSERDWLIKHHGPAADVFRTLFDGSQYQPGRMWRLT